MPRLLALLALCVVLVVMTGAATALAADPSTSPGMLPPTAPFADFNQPGQSSSALVATMHIRGPEKIIGTAVVVLLLIAVVMFAGMLRHAYGGARPRRP
jgi:ABC-type Fe3+-siderophore transport system permease subunit